MGTLGLFILVMWKLYPLTNMLHPSGVHVETAVFTDPNEVEVAEARAKQLGFHTRIDTYAEDGSQ